MKPDLFAEAREAYRIGDAWQMLRLPGEPKASCRSPFRDDHSPSFTIFDDGKAWKDHATGDGGDVVEFIRHAIGGDHRAVRDWLKERLEKIEQILSRHNFYDCDTILQLKHPETGRRALFVQSEMDVNVDGSDGDRNVQVDGSGQFFQPQTSYRWPKKTDLPNPFLAPLQEKLAAAQEELKKPGIATSRATELRERIEHWKLQIRDIQRWSFLVSEADPFIVLPGFMLRGSGDYVPKLGDYAVVIHRDKIYPAILGDAGPSYKMGEASLRLCKEINDTGTPLARPVSDLTVTYVVFPGSTDPERDAPDLERWRQRCVELLAEIGAPDAPVHRWENKVPPWPTPTPSPSPTPAETEAAAEVAPEASVTPSGEN
jgi:hypothetical protein